VESVPLIEMLIVHRKIEYIASLFEIPSDVISCLSLNEELEWSCRTVLKYAHKEILTIILRDILHGPTDSLEYPMESVSREIL
jgi:hypothetical protein